MCFNGWKTKGIVHVKVMFITFHSWKRILLVSTNNRGLNQTTVDEKKNHKDIKKIDLKFF